MQLLLPNLAIEISKWVWLGKKISLYTPEFLCSNYWKHVFCCTCTVSDSSLQDFCNELDILFMLFCGRRGLVSN